jgi:hypothetical protein
MSGWMPLYSLREVRAWYQAWCGATAVQKRDLSLKYRVIGMNGLDTLTEVKKNEKRSKDSNERKGVQYLQSRRKWLTQTI